MTEHQRIKQQAIGELRRRAAQQQERLAEIEPRLAEYYAHLCRYSGVEPGDPDDRHNVMELLGALKFLRLLRTYGTDTDTFRDVIYKYEGIWQQRDGVWHHVDGGLRHPGTTGPTHYRLLPFQVFVLASMFLFKVWISTEAEAGSRDLLDTEAERGGFIYDLRRLCTEFTLYTPRKTAKTQLSAFIQFWYFMCGDENAECYCCANSSDQSKILFNRTRDLIRQMDPQERRIRFTASQVNWKPGQFRTASLTALSAGGKTKDGLFAQLCSADEYGSAAYVNGASDMGRLVSVVESSMGPRRNPMTFISTTAGINTTGPFIDKLAGIHKMLERELDPDAVHTVSDDRQACLCLEPDVWEQQDDELLLTSKAVRHKVNGMLGIIVQHSFYDDEIAKARQNPEKMNEVICKLFNTYKGVRVTHWITGDRIRPLQVSDPTRRIESCRWQDGWRVFIGLDFALGDDLFAVTYLGVDYNHAQHADTMRGLLFADTDAWVLEATLEKSPNKALYEQWIKQGWLHVCPGEVFDSSYAIAVVAKRLQLDVAEGVKDWRLDVRLFCYDPAQNREPINNLKAWLQTAGIPADAIEKMVIPCSQSAMNLNGTIGALEEKILGVEPWIEFSASPLFPWCFGNTAVEIGRTDLRRIVKGGPQASAKIDVVMALLDALWGWQLSEGQIQGNQ